MKTLLFKLILCSLFTSAIFYAQNTESVTIQKDTPTHKPYNENEDALTEIQKLISQAKKENKNIILQAGGNWCIWCLRFDKFIKTTPEIKEIVENNFLYYHLNFSPKNKNDNAFAKYGEDGKKLGYPFFIVLNKNGERIHLQGSEIFEEGKSYNIEKVKNFFESWINRN